MPLPIAHGLIGASVVAALHPDFLWKRDRGFLLLGAFLGVVPDLDYGLDWIGLLGQGWRHSVTHSILFGLLAGAFCARLVERANPWAMPKYISCLLSHSFLDFLYTDSQGVELFWPISSNRYALNLMPPIEYSFREHASYSMLAELLMLCLVELFVCGALLGAILIWRKLFRLFLQSATARRKSDATSRVE
jgi:hypothetical protein